MTDEKSRVDRCALEVESSVRVRFESLREHSLIAARHDRHNTHPFTGESVKRDHPKAIENMIGPAVDQAPIPGPEMVRSISKETSNGRNRPSPQQDCLRAPLPPGRQLSSALLLHAL